MPEIPAEIQQKPTRALIYLDRLIRNLSTLKQIADPSGILPIIKADAYGHGLVRIAKTLHEEGVESLGVSFLEEGVALRLAGITGRILVMGGIVNAQIEHFLEYDLEMTASSEFIAAAISDAATRMGVQAKVHAKIDTGMSRIGVNWEQSESFFKTLASLPGIEVVGLYSHLATAEDTSGEGYDFAREQIRRFNVGIDHARKSGLDPSLIHLVNTAGLLNHHDARFTATRPGIALYGLPLKTNQSLDLPDHDFKVEPVLELVSEVVFIKGLRAGSPVSYGMTWRAPQNTWIATIPLGYGDGFPRELGNRGHVLIRGKRYPIVGAVCMDQLMVDVGPKDPPDVGEPVTLIGRQGDEEITVGEICRITGNIPYEIPILLTTRVPRIYLYRAAICPHVAANKTRAAGCPHPAAGNQLTCRQVPSPDGINCIRWQTPSSASLRQKEHTMIVTTTPTIEGQAIKEYKGLVSGEAIMGANIVLDFLAGIRDIVGGRSAAYEKKLLEAQSVAVEEMKERAKAMGANAIVGVDLDYEVLGRDNGMLMVNVNGTAVVI